MVGNKEGLVELVSSDSLKWYTYENVTAVANPCEKWCPNKDQFFGICFFPSTAVDPG